jgi:hypothetical protein
MVDLLKKLFNNHSITTMHYQVTLLEFSDRNAQIIVNEKLACEFPTSNYLKNSAACITLSPSSLHRHSDNLYDLPRQ